jgi:hypothetical protein
MDIKAALKEQYHATLAMLADCLEKCPEDFWNNPNPAHDEGDRVIYRPFWRIAFHGLFFTQLYMGQTVDDFKPWPNSPLRFNSMWGPDWEVEPFEFPEDIEPLSKPDMLDYLAYVDSLVDPIVDGLDLSAAESGVPWYKNFPKLNHELLTLRHLQGHVGQLSELLMARGIDSRWVSRIASQPSS